jgi:hypothetical protein
MVLGHEQKIRHNVNIGVGPNNCWNVYAAELIAIFFDYR